MVNCHKVLKPERFLTVEQAQSAHMRLERLLVADVGPAVRVLRVRLLQLLTPLRLQRQQPIRPPFQVPQGTCMIASVPQWMVHVPS